MLKIKNNVDLKELEKFGYEYKEENYDGEGKWHYYEKNRMYITELEEDFPQNERIINTEVSKFDGFDDEDIETLYDLIKADLVEKVDNNE